MPTFVAGRNVLARRPFNDILEGDVITPVRARLPRPPAASRPDAPRSRRFAHIGGKMTAITST